MEGETSEWCLSYNKKGRITGVNVGGKDSWVMYGPVFFSKAFSEGFLPMLERAYQTPGTEQFYWENVLMEHIGELEMDINRQPANQIYEFENLEELRLFDPKYQNRSDNQAMELVAEVLGVAESEIHDIKCLKAGMTNQSFLFKVQGRSYICRIPGKGTELLINRPQEAAVYEVIQPLGLAEHVVYLNPETGYKIAEYYEGAHNANASDREDMTQCMKALHRLHDAKLVVNHEFNLRERIDFYEKLCLTHGGTQFEDYELVRGRMDELMTRLDQLARPKYLSHIDSVADNFLFTADGDVRLIDWEYAGMCDPLVDVAMCAIYSYYNEEETDALIGIYLGREASVEERFVVYAYMALGGFLWSLWAIYKSALGVEFGDYTLVMYRYAKKYYRRAMAIVDNLA
jgi:thiamine kinase-like enzyme